MKQTLKYENMKFAEAKHSIVLTFCGAVIAFATTFLGNNAVENLFSVASILFSLIAILYSFVALVARKVRIKKRKTNKGGNLIFYKDIMHYDASGFILEIKKKYEFTKIYKEDNMDLDLAEDIIATSKLAYIKFLYFNFAVLFLIVSIVCIILSVLIRGGII